MDEHWIAAWVPACSVEELKLRMPDVALGAPLPGGHHLVRLTEQDWRDHGASLSRGFVYAPAMRGRPSLALSVWRQASSAQFVQKDGHRILVEGSGLHRLTLTCPGFTVGRCDDRLVVWCKSDLASIEVHATGSAFTLYWRAPGAPGVRTETFSSGTGLQRALRQLGSSLSAALSPTIIDGVKHEQ